MIDSGEVLALVMLNAIIDSILGLVIGLWLVARKAGQWARRDWTAWLESDDSLPYMDRVAERVEAKMEPRLTAFEERIGAPVQIDLEPIVAMVTNAVVPKVKEEIERVRAVIDGKIGWARKVGKNVGEALAERVGEEVAQEAGVSGAEGELLAELDGMLQDQAWVAEHKVAAFGLRLLKKEYISEQGGSGLTLQGRRGGPSKKGLLRLRR